jgi:hypothetical protein
MLLEVSYKHQRNPMLIARWMCASLVMIQMWLVPVARALEVLSARELASHCTLLASEPEGTDAQYCIRYIQGFIDGAVATDVRVMLNAEDALKKETFSERAIRTRLPSRADSVRAASLAGFCLGDPIQLRDVVDAVVDDLADEQVHDAPAMQVVDASLQLHFPCAS